MSSSMVGTACLDGDLWLKDSNADICVDSDVSVLGWCCKDGVHRSETHKHVSYVYDNLVGQRACSP